MSNDNLDYEDDVEYDMMVPNDSPLNSHNNMNNHILTKRIDTNIKSKNMIFQGGIQKKKVTYDDILGNMHLYVHDGKLHMISSDGNIKKSHPVKHTPTPTPEEIEIQRKEYNKRLYLEHIQRQKHLAQVAKIKSKKLIYRKDNREMEHDRQLSNTFFKLIGK